MMGSPRAPWRVVAAMMPGAVTLDGVGGCTRCGLPASSEAAAICAGMPRRWLFAALARWGCDDNARAGLKAALWNEAAGMAADEGWRLRRGVPLLETMAIMAVEEFLAPERPDGLPNRIPDQEKARRMDLRRNNWCKTWRPRYDRLAALPHEWLSEASSYIHRRQAA